MTANLPELLRDSLSSQLSVYKEIRDLQSNLLRNLDAQNELANIMGLLEKKNALLDKVKAENMRSASYVDEWVQVKKEIEDHITEIEKLVLELRAQDEAMLQRFDQESQSKNRIDAFRAMR